jgi:hypothetical protein
MAKYKIIWASSTVYHCRTCKSWVLRYPDFMGEPFDKGYGCEKCGCTSVTLSKGRSYGKKSVALKEFQREWDENEDFWIDWIYETDSMNTIKTIPELPRTN